MHLGLASLVEYEDPVATRTSGDPSAVSRTGSACEFCSTERRSSWPATRTNQLHGYHRVRPPRVGAHCGGRVRRMETWRSESSVPTETRYSPGTVTATATYELDGDLPSGHLPRRHRRPDRGQPDQPRLLESRRIRHASRYHWLQRPQTGVLPVDDTGIPTAGLVAVGELFRSARGRHASVRRWPKVDSTTASPSTDLRACSDPPPWCTPRGRGDGCRSTRRLRYQLYTGNGSARRSTSTGSVSLETSDSRTHRIDPAWEPQSFGRANRRGMEFRFASVPHPPSAAKAPDPPEDDVTGRS